ncbi:MAG: GNAT family N-acetyltransferase [Pseudoalteromonas prydzensis]|uniref:GNAT family N-acetyltransferase n=1 Tax=Pseudoalteromonas prydzensis TaxID=182141 RepID=UPI003F9E8367
MIRVAKKDDLTAILKLYKELRPADPELESNLANQTWLAMIEDPQTFLIVADIAGELASTCALTINKSIANGARPFAIIEHVITAQKFRRQGLSRQVLEFAINTAWQQNCCKVMLLSGEKLTAAHALYESVGLQADIEKGFVIKPPTALN